MSIRLSATRYNIEVTPNPLPIWGQSWRIVAFAHQNRFWHDSGHIETGGVGQAALSDVPLVAL